MQNTTLAMVFSSRYRGEARRCGPRHESANGTVGATPLVRSADRVARRTSPCPAPSTIKLGAPPEGSHRHMHAGGRTDAGSSCGAPRCPPAYLILRLRIEIGVDGQAEGPAPPCMRREMRT